MAKKPRALTRPITRAEALSYQRSHPNGPGRRRLGVTALAEINGPGAYERRYEATRRLLAEGDSMAGYTAKQRRAMKKMSPKRKAAFKKMLSRAPAISSIRPNRRRRKTSTRRKKATRRKNPAHATVRKSDFIKEQMRIGRSKKQAEASYNLAKGTKKGGYKANKKRKAKPKNGRKRAGAARRARGVALRAARSTPRARKVAARKRPLKKAFIARQRRRGRSQKQAEADWKLSYGRKLKTGRQTRKYAKGKFRAARSRIGRKSRPTYKYISKKGHVRDIPDYALLGYKSAAAMRQVYRTGTAKQRAALGRKLTRLMERRERAARKAASRIRAGRGVFTPNEIAFEEWEEMYRSNPRKRRRRKKTTKRRKRRSYARNRATPGVRRAKPRRKKRRTAKQKAASLRNIKKAQAARRKKRGRKKTTRRKTTRRKTTRRRKKLIARVYAANKRRGKRRSTTRRRKRRTYRRNQGAYAVNRGYASNRRRRKRRRSRKRTYRRNQGWAMELRKALKLGAWVTVGFAGHRALTHVVDDQLAKVDMFKTGALGTYRGLISGALVAALGIAGVSRLRGPMLRDARAPLGVGMAVSFIQAALTTVLNKMGGQGAKIAQYLSGYPNAEGMPYGPGALGSYYTFTPHEIFPTSGMGSYYMVPEGYSGFGQPMLTQAAAGMGQPMLAQAAAGMGQPMLTQAAAGMGQAQLTQAAAGTGEYIVYGASGIGEYEETPVSYGPAFTDEGIYPNLHSAEQALSVAEAAAGVGSPEVPLQSTVNPMTIADPITDLPGGSRAGVFQGGDGIFG